MATGSTFGTLKAGDESNLWLQGEIEVGRFVVVLIV